MKELCYSCRNRFEKKDIEPTNILLAKIEDLKRELV